MEETLNKTENKVQVDFSNIRDLQNIIKTNGISKLAMGVKSLKQRLSVVSAKIADVKKKADVKPVEKPVEVKPVATKTVAPEQQPATKTVEQKPAETAKKHVFENKAIYQQNRQNSFGNRQSDNNNYQNLLQYPILHFQLPQ